MPVTTSLTDTRLRRARTPGLHLIQPRGEHGAAIISSWRLRLDAGASATFQRDGEETVVVLQQGRARWTAGQDEWTVSRTSVFTERATALLLPPGVPFSCTALAAPGPTGPDAPDVVEVILMSAPADAGGSVALIRPDDVQVQERGRDGYSRTVHDLFVRDPHGRRLMVGETFNPPGHWSSFPPHKHDGRDGEPALEEIYHYRVHPPQGFGLQMMYAAGGESAIHDVRDGDVVVLPYGYHPVCSPPGYHLYYLWGMAGGERRLALYEDPAHRWIHDTPGR